MGYVIKADYTTGDSERSEETYTELFPVWQDLSQAKKALKLLAEHHSYYEAGNSRWYTGKLDPKEAVNRPWYIQVGTWPESWQFSALVPLDDGTLTTVDVPYHGYFESLHQLTIIAQTDEVNDMCIRF